MRNLRTFGAACVLALMLAAPAFAGHIQTGVTDPQPSPSPTSTTSTEETGAGSVAGHIQTGVTSTDSAIEAALSLLQIVLALP